LRVTYPGYEEYVEKVTLAPGEEKTVTVVLRKEKPAVTIDRYGLYWPDEAEEGKYINFKVPAKINKEVSNPTIRITLESGPASVTIKAMGSEEELRTGETLEYIFRGTYSKDSSIELSGSLKFKEAGTYTFKIEAGYYA